VLHLVGNGNKPAIMPLTVPVLRVLEACRGQRNSDRLVLRLVSASRSTDATPTGWWPGAPLLKSLEVVIARSLRESSSGPAWVHGVVATP